MALMWLWLTNFLPCTSLLIRLTQSCSENHFGSESIQQKASSQNLSFNTIGQSSLSTEFTQSAIGCHQLSNELLNGYLRWSGCPVWKLSTSWCGSGLIFEYCRIIKFKVKQWFSLVIMVQGRHELMCQMEGFDFIPPVDQIWFQLIQGWSDFF